MLSEYFNQTDTAVYFVMGAAGSLLFLLKVILLMAFGVDDGSDFDVGAGDVDAGGGAFHLFSMLSIVSFMMGMGWMGVAARAEWGFGPFAAMACAMGFGFLLMLMSSGGMYAMKKANSAGKYDARHCVGFTGKVYLRIPPKGEGGGQVEINVDGRRSILPAESVGPEIASFAAVRVMKVKDDNQTLVVEPA